MAGLQLWGLRHGLSIANEKDLVIAHPENGIQGYGLSPLGREETQKAIAKIKIPFSPDDSYVYSSPFRRAIETAEIFCSHFGLRYQIDDRLSERFFGGFEGEVASKAYPYIWSLDEKDPTHTTNGVESAQAVLDRLLSFLDSLLPNKNYVLVSHGDPLKILYAHLKDRDIRRHTAYSFANAQLIRMPV